QAQKAIYYIIPHMQNYFDEHKEYWHVMLPRELSKQVPKTHLMSEGKWKRPGVQQSLSWVHYTTHKPESRTWVLIPDDQQKPKI
uniref:Cyclin-dependent kinases regulatory subunit n=1 Tax=Neovison vison TaxID=452646 RepID=A0A8C7ELB3_NEOVI